MVSSPVSDLLNESNTSDMTETFEQENTLENADGKTLEIYRFLDDGVKMVSVNGFKLSLSSLLEMVGVDIQEQRQEDFTWDNSLFVVFMLSMSMSAATLFLALIRV
jgi:hypothetical protein